MRASRSLGALCAASASSAVGASAAAPPCSSLRTPQPRPWIAAILVLALVASCECALPFPPRSISGPWATPPINAANAAPAVHWANIISPASLEGSLGLQPAIFGSHWNITTTIGGWPAFEGEIVLPHIDDDPMGCPYLDGRPFRSSNELNDTFAGKVVLVRRGACSFGQKALPFLLHNASAVIMHGCSPDAPTFCDPGLITMSAIEELPIPMVYIQGPDGFKMHDHIRARNKQRLVLLSGNASAIAEDTIINGGLTLDPVFLQVPTTGPMDPADRAALAAIASVMTVSSDTEYYGYLRPWSVASLTDPSLDPCLDRIAGLWCENSRVVEIQYGAVEGAGSVVSEGWRALTALRYLDLSLNTFTGPVPEAMCDMSDLRVLSLSAQNSGNLDGFTSLPSCLSQLTELIDLYVSLNAIEGALPDLSLMPHLQVMDCSGNLLSGALDSGLGSLTELVLLFANGNAFTSVPLLMGGMSALTTVSLANNQIGGVLTDQFEGCAALETLDISHNQIEGPLPPLVGCAALSELSVQYNRFNSTIPFAWQSSLPALVTLHASHNELISPVAGIGSLTHLAEIDLSFNRLSAVTVVAAQAGNVGAFISGIAGPSCATLNLAHNSIAGEWDSGWLNAAVALRTLYLEHNAIQTLDSGLFTTSLTYVDISHNNLTAWGDLNTPAAHFTYLNLQGNPRLRVTRLPPWVTVSSQMLSNAGEPYSCPSLGSGNPQMKLLTDALWSNYLGCVCSAGTFGAPPLCYSVPLSATLSADGLFSSSEVGADFNTIVHAAGGQANVTAADGTPRPAFSDSWYGADRLTLGLATSWVLDLSAQNASGPVRVIHIRMHLSAALFSRGTDVLTVYEGDGSLTGARVAQLRGSDPVPSPSAATVSAVSSPSYQSLYGASLSALGPNSSVWDVMVLTGVATVSFSSRASSGTHFFATYAHSSSCPEEHYLMVGVQRCVPCYAASGMFFDTQRDMCRPNLVDYEISTAVRAAVWAVAAVAFAAVFACVLLVLRHWETAVIRAASRSFLLLLLGFLAMMPLAAVLFAERPEESATGRVLCDARVWLCGLSLTGVLSVLLAKNARVKTIFGSEKLQVRKVTDGDLLLSVSTLVSVVSVMLAILSGAQLTQPSVDEGEGALSGQIIAQCLNSDGYSAWVGCLIAYITCLCLCAAFLGFKTRHIPSRFNEGTQILNALVVMLLFGVIVVPLDILVQSNPQSAVMIQGVGAGLLCLLLTAILFAPKAYLLLSVSGTPTDQHSVLDTKMKGEQRGSVLDSALSQEGAPAITRPQPSTPMLEPAKPHSGVSAHYLLSPQRAQHAQMQLDAPRPPNSRRSTGQQAAAWAATAVSDRHSGGTVTSAHPASRGVSRTGTATASAAGPHPMHLTSPTAATSVVERDGERVSMTLMGAPTPIMATRSPAVAPLSPSAEADAAAAAASSAALLLPGVVTEFVAPVSPVPVPASASASASAPAPAPSASSLSCPSNGRSSSDSITPTQSEASQPGKHTQPQPQPQS